MYDFEEDFQPDNNGNDWNRQDDLFINDFDDFDNNEILLNDRDNSDEEVDDEPEK